MTKENLNQLKSLISSFNESNKENDVYYCVSDIHEFSLGKFSLTLMISRLMFSLDLHTLMQFCLENGVYMHLMNHNGMTYLDFQ